MNKLTRKQCNAIIKTRASMLSVKTNHKKSNGPNLVCRFCSETEETQENILQTCQKVGKRVTKLKYGDAFKEDTSKLKKISEEIIRVENLLKNPSKQHELLTHEWATRTIWAYALQQQTNNNNNNLYHFSPWWRHQMETLSALLPFVRVIHRLPVDSPHKGQWRGGLIFDLRLNKQLSKQLRRHRAQYDVTVIHGIDVKWKKCFILSHFLKFSTVIVNDLDHLWFS